MKKALKIFESCVPVRGAKRSVICDLQRNTYDFIPNSLYDVIVKFDGMTYDEIAAEIDPEHVSILDSYISFLIEKEYAFFTATPESFPRLSMHFESPQKISNAIIDVDSNSNHDFPSILKQLEDLGCLAVELRCYSVIDDEKLVEILELVKDSGFRAIQPILLYKASYGESDFLPRLLEEHLRVPYFIVHGAPPADNRDKNYGVVFIEETITDETHCGVINSTYFTINISLFTESHHFNNCLNRKISIDRFGFIRNCPSFAGHYGHHSSQRLAEVVEMNSFRSKWTISKDEINICRDCEFRFICTDCRAYTQPVTEDGLHPKPAKCSYDPYTAKWGEGQERPAFQMRHVDAV